MYAKMIWVLAGLLGWVEVAAAVDKGFSKALSHIEIRSRFVSAPVGEIRRVMRELEIEIGDVPVA